MKKTLQKSISTSVVRKINLKLQNYVTKGMSVKKIIIQLRTHAKSNRRLCLNHVYNNSVRKQNWNLNFGVLSTTSNAIIVLETSVCEFFILLGFMLKTYSWITTFKWWICRKGLCLYTLSFNWSHKKHSCGVISGVLGGQSVPWCDRLFYL